MVLRVGLEVVDIDGWQAGDEQLQLDLVEDGDESLGNDVVESLQEGVELLADCARHLHLAHQLHVLTLVLLRHRDVAAILFQITHFRHPKLLDLREKKHALNNAIVPLFKTCTSVIQILGSLKKNIHL